MRVNSIITASVCGLILVAGGCSTILDTDSLNTGDGSSADSAATDVVVERDAERPAAGINVEPSAGLTTSEGGGSSTFEVWLASAPTSTVVILVTSTDPSEGVVDKDDLTFEPANYNAKQTVTVTGVDDDLADGPQVFTITLSPAQSQDNSYRGIDPEDVQVTNSDDETPGVRISSTSLTTTEAAGAEHERTFTVELNTKPAKDVTITFTSGNPAEGLFVLGSETSNTATLTFTPDNFAAAQTVTVRGVDDNVVDGDVSYTLSSSASSEDPAYDDANAQLDLADIAVTNRDDDVAQIVADNASGLSTSETGSTATFTVRLTSRPSGNVVINVSVTGSEGALTAPAGGALTFTSTGGEWQSGLPVTVRGQDDDVVDGPKTFRVALAVNTAETQDTNYRTATPPGPFDVTNADDDTAAIVYEVRDGITTEGAAADTAEIVVRLTKQPSAPVTINITVSQNTDEATITAPAGPNKRLTFPAGNTGPQTVVIAANNDEIDDGDQPFELTFTPDPGSAPGYGSLAAEKRSVTVKDDGDQAGITIGGTPLTTGEDETEDQFTIVLDSQPSAGVDVRVSLADPNNAALIVGVGEGSRTINFDGSNWSTPVPVTLKGRNNNATKDDPPQTYRVTFALTTTASEYASVTVGDITVTHTDND